MYPAITPELGLRLAHADATDRLTRRPPAARRALRSRLGHALVVAGTRLERTPRRRHVGGAVATMVP